MQRSAHTWAGTEGAEGMATWWISIPWWGRWPAGVRVHALRVPGPEGSGGQPFLNIWAGHFPWLSIRPNRWMLGSRLVLLAEFMVSGVVGLAYGVVS